MLNEISRKAIYTILIAALLAACNPTIIASQSSVTMRPTNDPMAASFTKLLAPAECSTPCWIGIEVDKTSFNDAKKILIARYGVENIKSVKNENLIVTTQGIDGLIEGYLIFSNTVVVEVLLIFDDSKGPTVDNVLEIFGDPTWIYINSQPNNHCLRLALLYPTTGVYIDLNTNEHQNGIRPSENIFLIRFLQTKITKNWNVNDGYLVKWEGYQEYCGM